MKIVGLTGGIGSGKSTVAKMFIELGVPVYDSDKEAKQLMSTSKKLRKAIIQLLGKEAYQDKELNRAFIAGRVFDNAQLLEKLNKIVHPAVREHFLNWVEEQDSPYVIQESALIFENGNEDFYDAIILITAPVEIRLERVNKRDGSKEDEAMKRIKNQMEDELKRKMSHFHIQNINLQTTQKEVFHIHETLVKSSE